MTDAPKMHLEFGLRRKRPEKPVSAVTKKHSVLAELDSWKNETQDKSEVPEIPHGTRKKHKGRRNPVTLNMLFEEREMLFEHCKKLDVPVSRFLHTLVMTAVTGATPTYVNPAMPPQVMPIDDEETQAALAALRALKLRAKKTA